MPGWRKGVFGTIGGNISQFSDWFSQGTPNVSSGNIGVTINGFANLKEEKFFWRNAANINSSHQTNNKLRTENESIIERYVCSFHPKMRYL